MELRDWLIIVIPIICNGLIIFAVQKFASTKLERKMKIFFEKRDSFIVFKGIIDEILLCINEIRCAENGKKQSKLLIELVDLINKKILPFHDSNQILLGKHIEAINEILKKARQMTEAFASTDLDAGEKHINELKELFVSFGSRIEKEIYNY